MRQFEKEAELATNTAAVSHRATEEGHGGGRGAIAADLLQSKILQSAEVFRALRPNKSLKSHKVSFLIRPHY